jgi:cell division septation protein DedD
VAVQSQNRIVGTMALAAAVAVVIAPPVAEATADREDVVGTVADKTRVPRAVRADGAGTYIPPFFRSFRPV